MRRSVFFWLISSCLPTFVWSQMDWIGQIWHVWCKLSLIQSVWHGLSRKHEGYSDIILNPTRYPVLRSRPAKNRRNHSPQRPGPSCFYIGLVLSQSRRYWADSGRRSDHLRLKQAVFQYFNDQNAKLSGLIWEQYHSSNAPTPPPLMLQHGCREVQMVSHMSKPCTCPKKSSILGKVFRGMPSPEIWRSDSRINQLL